MADKQTITVPGIGDVDFPSAMSDDQIHDAIVRNYPDMGARSRTSSALDSLQNPAKAFNFGGGQLPSLVSSVTRGLTPTPGFVQKQKARQQFNYERQAGQREANKLLEQNKQGTIGPNGELLATTPLTPAPVRTAQEANTPLDNVLSSGQRLAAQHKLSTSGNLDPQVRKQLRAQLEASNVAVGGTSEDPSGSSALAKELYQNVARHPAVDDFIENNTGMSPEFLDTLFKPTSRTPGTLETGDSRGLAVTKGLARAGLSTARGLTTPESMAMLGAMAVAPESGLGRLANLGFTGQMLYEGGKGTVGGAQDLARGELGTGTEKLAGGALNLGLGGLGALHGINELRRPSATETPASETAPTPEPVAPREERRSNSDLREAVSKMSPDEAVKTLFTNPVTGLPNKRAFQVREASKPSAAIGMTDVDGLKAVNDTYGHAAGDALLKAKADALTEAGLDAYHTGGDEFLHRDESPSALESKLKNAQEILRNKEISAPTTDGGTVKLKGATFSYGMGASPETADAKMYEMKSSREISGERKRGVFGGSAQTVNGPLDEIKHPHPDFVYHGTTAPRTSLQEGTFLSSDPEEAGVYSLKGQLTSPNPSRYVYALPKSTLGLRDLGDGHYVVGEGGAAPSDVTAQVLASNDAAFAARQKAEYPNPQATNPSEATPPIEDAIRKNVGTLIRVKQLQASARQRLDVQLALKEHYADFPIPVERLEPVAKALGIAPDDLRDTNYRLTDDQASRLERMLKEGKKSPTVDIEHPEAHFAEKGIAPLAEINEQHLRAAGLPSPKDRYALLTSAEKRSLQEFKASTESSKGAKQAAEAEAYSPDEDNERSGALSILSAKEAGLGGIVSKGRDADTLQFEHDLAQKVLERRLKNVRDELKGQIPEWQKSREDSKAPSKLSQDITALNGSLRTSIPRELYAKQHLTPEGSKAPQSPTAMQPLQSPETAGAPKSAEATEGSLKDKIVGLSKQISDTHGEEAFGALPTIFDAVATRYKSPEAVNSALYATIRKYAANLDNGVEGPLKDALENTLAKLGPEKPGQTLYSNPIGPLFDKLFGSRKTPTVVQPLKGATLPESAIGEFTKALPTSEEGLKASAQVYLNNEIDALKDFAHKAPQNFATFGSMFREAVNGAWEAYKTRPGLNPFELALGKRRLTLTASAVELHKFVESYRDLKLDNRRESALVNYLQSGGGVNPERDVLAELQLKATSFPKERGDLTGLRKGYEDAQNLTDKEKQVISAYREYDKRLTAEEEAKGLVMHRVENYIRQVWDQHSFANRSAQAVFSVGSFATKGTFEKMRRYESYFEGEMAGLTPKKKSFSYLVAARARASAEVLANRDFIETLHSLQMPDGSKWATTQGTGIPQGTEVNPKSTEGALLVTPGRPPEAITPDGRPYVTVNHPAFANWKWVGKLENGSPVMYRGNMLVHPDGVDQVKRILEPSAIRKTSVGRTALKMQSIGKQTLLIGLFHPVQLGVHFTEHAAEGSTTARTMKTLNPFSKPILDMNDSIQQMLVVHGLKVADFNAESLWDEGVMSRGLANGAPVIGKFLSNLHEAMFQRYIPNIKMGMALDALNRNMSRYHDVYKAEELKKGTNSGQASLQAQSRIYRMTSEQMNSAFGGINWDHLPVSKTWQDVARLTVLAPDFLLARMQFVGDSLRPGGMESRKALLIGAFVQYTLTRALNAAMNDGDAKWAPQDWNKLIIGHREYGLRTVQGDLTDSIFDTRRFFEHRLNPVLMRPLLEAGFYPGAKGSFDIWGHRASAGQQLFDFAKNIVPMPLQGSVEMAAQNFGWSQRRTQHDERWADTILQSLGVQSRTYRSPAEKYVFSKFDEIQGQSTSDDLALEQKQTFKILREQYQKGTLKDDDLQAALDNGSLKESQIKYLWKTAKETRIASESRQLQPTEVLSAWAKGTERERMQLLPVAWSKVKQLPLPQQEKAYAKLDAWLSSKPEAEQEKLTNQAVEELQYEYPPPPEPEEATPQETPEQ